MDMVDHEHIDVDGAAIAPCSLFQPPEVGAIVPLVVGDRLAIITALHDKHRHARHIESGCAGHDMALLLVFDDADFDKWPTRTAGQQRDRLDKMFERLEEGIRQQLDSLGGNGGRGGRKSKGRRLWYREVDGIYFCRVEGAGKTMILNEAGDTAIKVKSVEKAVQLYERIYEVGLEGEPEMVPLFLLRSSYQSASGP